MANIPEAPAKSPAGEDKKQVGGGQGWWHPPEPPDRHDAHPTHPRAGTDTNLKSVELQQHRTRSCAPPLCMWLAQQEVVASAYTQLGPGRLLVYQPSRLWCHLCLSPQNTT